MSSQSSHSTAIPFSITHPQQNFRLIELPADLVNLITSDNRPDSLHLKSAAPLDPSHLSNGTSTSTKPFNSKEGFLHLCSNDKVWAVRQVSTSNSVYITAPWKQSASNATSNELSRKSHPAAEGSTRNGDDTTHPQDLEPAEQQELQENRSGITAISQVSNVLELIETQTTTIEVEDVLRKYVPILEDPSDEAISNVSNNRASDSSIPNQTTQQSRNTLRQLHDDIPAPNKLIKQAIQNLLIFEHDGSCYTPSPQLQLKAWTLLVQTATIAGTKFDGEKEATNFEPLVSTIGEDEGVVYAAVLRPIVRSLLLKTEHEDEDTMDRGQRSPGQQVQSPSSSSIYGHLDPAKTVPYIGRLVLQSIDPIKGMQVTEFMEQWTNLVPGSWLTHCRIEVLEGRYEVRRQPKVSVTKKRKQTVFVDEDEDMQDNDDAGENTAVGEEGLEEHIYPITTTSAVAAEGTVSSQGIGGGIGQETSKPTAGAGAKDNAASVGKRKWHEKFAAQRKR